MWILLITFYLYGSGISSEQILFESFEQCTKMEKHINNQTKWKNINVVTACIELDV